MSAIEKMCRAYADGQSALKGGPPISDAQWNVCWASETLRELWGNPMRAAVLALAAHYEEMRGEPGSAAAVVAKSLRSISSDTN